MARGTHRNAIWLVTALVIVLLAAGCGGKKRNQAQDPNVEPDKVLFERATEDIRKGRHTVARLTLQTLINTYPDSEYLAKAKLAIADSYFKEGGSSGLAQAVIEYKDFGTFFPFLDEAAYAQMQLAMAHYRRMEKPDRDRTYARLAEEEFQRFLITYSNHPLAPQAEQRLREVQEVLAEGDFRIARYYYIKGSLRASGARILELVDRYPLYSQSDRALWMLGDIYERAERAEIASRYYARIVSEYPLSPIVEDAKLKLVALGVPVPQPNPEALARMQKEKEFEPQRSGIMGRALGMLKTGPDVSEAARTGPPNLNPPTEPVSPSQTLTPPPGGRSPDANLGIGVVTPGGSPPASGGTTPPSTDGNSQPATDPSAAKTEKPTESSSTSALPSAKGKSKKQLEEERKKKEEEEKKKKEKEKESSSKKKKGLRKIIPW
jgi:outer membrane protein assembly factor BamD